MLKAKGSEYEQLQCPYIPSHMIDRCRFQLHLNRCRKSHKNVPLVECPFNNMHQLNKPELDWHVSICPDRQSYETFKHPLPPASRSVPSPVKDMPKMELNEDWDKDPDVPTYNPRVYAENAAVLRLCQNAPPLERKTFRKNEHLRLRGLEDS